MWDIAQFADGTDRDDLTVYGDSSNSDPANNLTFNDDLLAVDYETWDTTFKEITDSIGDYRLTIDGFDEYVPGKGLKSVDTRSTEPPIKVRAENCYFSSWLTPLDDYLKFTREPDPFDDAVEFTFDKNCDLFLAPSMVTRNASAYFNDDINGDDYYYMYSVQAPIPRFTVSDPEFQTVWDNRGNPSVQSAIDVSYFRNLIFTDRSPTYSAAFNGGSESVIGPATGFPTLASEADWQNDPTIWMYPKERWGPHTVGVPVGGHCLGAIRKRLSDDEFEWYFIWADDFMSGTDPSGLGGTGFWYYGVNLDGPNGIIV